MLLKYLWQQGNEQAVKDVLSDMRIRNIKPTSDGGAVLLALYAKLKNRQKYREQYKDMMERQLINQKVYQVVKPHLEPEQRSQFEADIALTLKKQQSCVLGIALPPSNIKKLIKNVVGRAQEYTERALKFEIANNVQGVKKIVKEMDNKAIPVPYIILSTFIKMLVAAYQWEEAFEIFNQFSTRNIFAELPLYELMIQTAAKVQQYKHCESLFACNVSPLALSLLMFVVDPYILFSNGKERSDIQYCHTANDVAITSFIRQTCCIPSAL